MMFEIYFTIITVYVIIHSFPLSAIIIWLSGILTAILCQFIGKKLGNYLRKKDFTFWRSNL
jgi:hypothetical protein